jgi:hypothetical protein
MTPHHWFVRRLRWGLGALVAMSLLGLVAILVSEQRVGSALERSQTTLSLLEEFKEVQIALSAARAAEREFLLEDLRTPNFFNTGTSPALESHARVLSRLDVLLTSLEAHPAAARMKVAEIRQAVADYGERFGELVSLYRERGSLYTGLLGRMRRASFTFQELLTDLDEAHQTPIRAELLELIRDQGDYLRDLDNRPRFLVSERLQVLHEEIEELGAAPRKAQLEAEIVAFEQAWKRLLEIDDRIGRSSGAGLRGELRAAQETVIPLTLAAVERARAGFEAAAGTVEATAAMARRVSSGAVLLAFGVGIFLSISLGRQLQTSLAALLHAVEAYARGDRSARVGSLPRRDEFAVLGESFDRMAETLAETTEELEEINASLELAVRGDTTGLVERIKALVAQRKTPGL